ncbi:MAG: alpha/beta hydrolase [Anaerolineales bacterium]
MTSLHYLDPNPPGRPFVLLLHGLGADGTSWGLQLPALNQAGFRPIAPDVPGFGGSPYDGQGWSIRRVAAQMAGLLEELGSGPTQVVGISMGGVIAQQFALDYPQLTQRLVLVSTFAILRPENFGGWWYFMRRWAAVLTLGLQAQGRVVAQRIFPEPEQAALRELLEATISRADPRAYRAAMRSLGLFDSCKKLASLHVPTLIVTGQNDSTVSPLRQQVLVKGIPGARQVLIPKAGHAVTVDQAEQFNRALLDFLGE